MALSFQVFDCVPPRVKRLPKKGEWKPGQATGHNDTDAALPPAEPRAAPAAAAKPATEPFLINLIDSPGHVDFSSEVTILSVSLAASNDSHTKTDSVLIYTCILYNTVHICVCVAPTELPGTKLYVKSCAFF
jgi:hypothetical protein